VHQVLALVGPTAVGKTALALALAEHLPVEVLSADSRTVYRWMDMATAKPTAEEQARLPHHLIDLVDPDETYSLAVYQRQALQAIERIVRRGRMPLLVGGAGLYVSAVCDGLALPDVPPDVAFRQALEHRARLEGWPVLQADLAAVDAESAARIDPRNVRRVIRALEVFHATGRPFSAWQRPSQDWPIASVQVGLRLERAQLYSRIDARIDSWMAGGFVDEVRGLLKRGFGPSLPSMSGLGYREVASYLAGETDLADAAAQFKQATHQYAKRQMTWFGRRPQIRWFEAASVTPEVVLELVRSSPPGSRA
jgi:tRNA dimethylallyltransferase